MLRKLKTEKMLQLLQKYASTKRTIFLAVSFFLILLLLEPCQCHDDTTDYTCRDGYETYVGTISDWDTLNLERLGVVSRIFSLIKS